MGQRRVTTPDRQRGDRNAGRFEGRSSAASFILSIARHRGIDQVRRQGGREFEEMSYQEMADLLGISIGELVQV